MVTSRLDSDYYFIYKTCEQCGKEFVRLSFKDYAYRIPLTKRSDDKTTYMYFCCYSCLLKYRREHGLEKRVLKPGEEYDRAIE